MFEITIKEVDPQNLLVIDETHLFRRLPTLISSMKMTVTGVRVAGGYVDDLDMLEYMRYNQTDNELYRITSNTLGQGVGNNISDGVYEIKIVVNNSDNGVERIVVLNEIQASIQKLAEEFSFDIDINDNYIFGSNLPLSNSVLRFNYVMALYQSLLWNVGMGVSASIINDHIDKLQRLLNIVSNDPN